MSSSGTSDITVHPDQQIKDAYMVAQWNSLDPTAPPGSNVLRAMYNPDGSQVAPYSFGIADVNNAVFDFHVNFFVTFMSGIDIEALNDSLQSRMINSPTVNNEIAAHNVYLEDHINQNVLPKFRANMRDIGGVISSQFLDGQSLVEMNKQKELSAHISGRKLEMLKISQARWDKHLQWNKSVTEMYLQELSWYFIAADNWFKFANDVAAKNALWPWTILDNYRAIVGCINGAPAGRSSTETPSGLAQAGTYVGMAAGLTNMASTIIGGSGKGGGGGGTMISSGQATEQYGLSLSSGSGGYSSGFSSAAGTE